MESYGNNKIARPNKNRKIKVDVIKLRAHKFGDKFLSLKSSTKNSNVITSKRTKASIERNRTKAKSTSPQIYKTIIYPLIISDMSIDEISDLTHIKTYAIRNAIKRDINTNLSKRKASITPHKVAIIEDWVSSQDTLDNVAKLFYVSEGHVSKLIREYLGVKEGEVISLMSKI